MLQVQVQPLIGDLRSHMPPAKKPKQKNKEYCNEFNKEKTKNGPRQTKKKNLKNTRQRSGGMWSEFVAGWTVRLAGPLNSVTKTQKPLVPDGLQA